MTALLALAASLLWGTSDFLGGTASRRLPAASVVGISQGFALAGVVVVAAAAGQFSAPLGYLPWALAAGLVGLIALAAFYEALAIGTMGVVAPIAATGVLVPVLLGVAQGDRPNPVQGAGLAVAIAGVVLVSAQHVSAARAGHGARPLVLAAGAAVGFGLVIVFIQRGSQHNVVMTLLFMRLCTVVLLGLLALVLRRGPGARPADLPLLLAVGTGDVVANACYGVASRHGILPVVAVLSSLYPAATVLLARQVHHERLRPVQWVGVLAALLGVALIGAGGGTG